MTESVPGTSGESAEKTVCFLCCREIHDDGTSESFVPHFLYRGGRVLERPDLSLPVHRACSAFTSDHEQSMAAAFARPHPFGNRPFRPPIPTRHVAQPFVDRFKSRIVELPKDGTPLPD